MESIEVEIHIIMRDRVEIEKILTYLSFALFCKIRRHVAREREGKEEERKEGRRCLLSRST
jgi:hypothetical protein